MTDLPMTNKEKRIAVAVKAMRDLAHPGELANALTAIADDCGQSAEDCAAAWQDGSAGYIWRMAAKRISATAAAIETAWRKA